MIKIILSSFLVTLLYTPFGIYFYRESNLRSYSLQLIFGLIVISFFALTLNFFFPLNRFYSSILLLLSLIILISNKKYFLKKNFLLFCLFSTFIIFLLITNSNSYRPDAGLYHLPYINMLNEEKIILGSSNIHFRFGHTSIVQYLSAIMNNFINGTNGIVFPSALIASAVIINFISNLLNYIKNKNLSFHFFFLLSLLVFIVYKMNRYSEYGNDAPAHFLMFLLVSEVIKNFKNLQLSQISNYFLLAIFVIMNKVILITSVLFPLLIFLKNFNIKNLISKKNSFIIIFLILWSIKNIMVSGCFLYPIKFTCVENLVWTDINNTERVSIENEAWAKGWPDFRESESDVKQNDYNSNLIWINTWLNNHFLKILEILLPYVVFLTLILLVFRGKSKSFENKGFIRNLTIICLVGILIWFYKVPAFRYGYSNIIIFISIIFAFVGHKSFKKNYYNKFKYLILILFAIFSFKNLERIIFDDKYYFNYPWPKFYSYDEHNKIKKNEYRVINNKKIYFSNDGYCMYSQAPCGEIDKDIQIKIKKNYLIVFNDF